MMIQVKCTTPQLCNDNGIYAVVTDYAGGDRTNFTLSPPAFSHLGCKRNPVASEQLKKYGVVDIVYKRVPCRYSGRNNIVFKVQESSNNPVYFAVVLLNVGGANDVTAIELWQVYMYIWLHQFFHFSIYQFLNY